MKKVTGINSFVGACLLLFGSIGEADNSNSDFLPPEGEEKSFVVNLNPVGYISSQYLDLGLFYKILSHSSFGLQINYLSYRSSGTDFTGFGGDLRWNYCFSGKGLGHSWYLSSSAGVLPFSFTNTLGNTSLIVFPLRILAGYQWIFQSGLSIALGAGLTYYIAPSTTSIGAVPSYSGLEAYPELRVGLAL